MNNVDLVVHHIKKLNCLITDCKDFQFTRNYMQFAILLQFMHCKNIRRFYGKITGNQLPVHFPLFFTDARKPFQESGTER